MDRQQRYKIGMKSKKKKKISKCIEKYFAATFLVSDTQLYADKTLYLKIFFRKLECHSHAQSYRA